MNPGIILVIIALFVGCSHGGTPEVAIPPHSLSERALHLMAQGDYVGASWYLEAELRQNGQEDEILPRLIEAQIRACRLHAALQNLKRLHTLYPANPAIRELFHILVEVSGISMTLPAEEV